MSEESRLNITYYPSITSEKFPETITLDNHDYFTAGELIEALKYFDEDTAIYVSNSKYGHLCRILSYEPDGTITLSDK